MSFYHVIKSIACGFTRLLFPIRFEGVENIPQSGGYILVSNHRSNFDPIFIADKMKAHLYFMAKAELFRIPVFGALLRGLKAFPVERGKGDTGTMDWAGNLIKEGKVLVMFPEGTRSKDGTPLRPRSGVSVIAAKTEADILPCAVTFGSKLKFRTPIVVRYGPLIKHSELELDSGTPSSIRKCSKLIMERIVALLG